MFLKYDIENSNLQNITSLAGSNGECRIYVDICDGHYQSFSDNTAQNSRKCLSKSNINVKEKVKKIADDTTCQVDNMK